MLQDRTIGNLVYTVAAAAAAALFAAHIITGTQLTKLLDRIQP